MSPKEKRRIVRRLYSKGEPINTPDGKGLIDAMPQECSGVWGCEGDSIAVYVNGKPYPSTIIIRMNQAPTTQGT